MSALLSKIEKLIHLLMYLPAFALGAYVIALSDTTSTTGVVPYMAEHLHPAAPVLLAIYTGISTIWLIRPRIGPPTVREYVLTILPQLMYSAATISWYAWTVSEGLSIAIGAVLSHLTITVLLIGVGVIVLQIRELIAQQVTVEGESHATPGTG